MASGVSPSDFPSINTIVTARNAIATNKRQEELHPARVKQGQQQTELNAFNIAQNERTTGRQAEGDVLLERIGTGDPNALTEFARVDPGRFTAILEAQAKQRNMEVDEYQRGALQVGRLAVVGAQSPGDWKRLRDSTLKANPKIKPEDIPENPSPTWIKFAIAQMSAVAELQKAAGFGQGNALTEVGVKGKPGAKQRALVDTGSGKTTPVGPPITPAPKAGGAGGTGGDGGPGAFKTGVSGEIRRAVNTVMGEVFDPRSDQFSVLDPERQKLALAVARRAEEIMRQSGFRIGAAEAAARAAEEFGIELPKATNAFRPKPAPSQNSTRAGKPATGQAREKQLKAFQDFVNNDAK